MDELATDADVGAAVRELRRAGATFAFVHGSRATSTARPDSDLDLAAWWAGAPPASFEVGLPRGVDLMVLNDAPLELAGRVSVQGRLVLDDDPAARIHWLAMTRKIYFDELPRITRSHREFREAMARGR